MAEAYSFSLLVELGNPDVPKVQNKLIKYFQSKKSNGGDCLVEVSNGQRAVVWFRTEEGKFYKSSLVFPQIIQVNVHIEIKGIRLFIRYTIMK